MAVPSPAAGSIDRSRPRIRVGVAGLGAVAQAVHLPLLARARDVFEIGGLADLSASLLEAIGSRYGVPAQRRHTSVDDLIAQPGLDAIVLLTSGSHGPAALAALDAGLAVLCEKPLATTVREADLLARSPNADRLLLGYMKVWDPAVERAAEILSDEAERFGPLRSIDVHVLHPTSEAQLEFARLLPPPSDVDDATLRVLRGASDELIRDALGERATAEFGRLYGAILLGSVVHELSVIRAVTGDRASLEIDHVDVWPDVWPPSVSVAGRLASGVRVSLGWHFLDRYPAYREEVRFHAPGGSVELTFPAPYRLNQPTSLIAETGAAETRERRVFESIEEAFERELLAFADLVHGDEAPRTGIEDGRTDIVTCQRIIASLAAQRGIPIGGEAATAGRDGSTSVSSTAAVPAAAGASSVGLSSDAP